MAHPSKLGLSLYTVRLHNRNTGKTRSQSVLADSALSAKEMIFVMHGESATAKLADSSSSAIARFLMRSQAGKKDLQAFYSSLYAANKMDDSFSEALHYSLLSVRGGALKNAILRTVKSLREVSATEAFQNFRGVIPDEHLESMIAGYTSGAITNVLRHLSEAVDKESKIMRKIMTALVQPGIVIVLALATALGMSIAVIPKIVGTLTGFGGEIPILTKVLIAFGEAVVAYPIQASIIGLSPILLVTQMKKIIASRPSQFVLQRLPGIGEIFFKASMGSALRTMGLLLEAGITTQDALVLVSKVGKHNAVQEFFVKMDISLRKGKGFFESASNHAGLLGKEGPSFIALLKMGSDKGNLDEIVTRLGVQYVEEVEVKTETIEKFINPIAMILAGGIVLLVVMALVMPMTNIYSNIL